VRVQQEKLDSQNKKNKKQKQGSIFITRSKEHLSVSGTVGVVLSSEEAVLDHIGQATHWTPNVY
ncbi:replication initiation protein, partial [Bacillus velezensis]